MTSSNPQVSKKQVKKKKTSVSNRFLNPIANVFRIIFIVSIGAVLVIISGVLDPGSLSDTVKKGSKKSIVGKIIYYALYLIGIIVILIFVFALIAALVREIR